MRRLQKAHSREQPGFHIGGRAWLGTQSPLQTVRRSNRPNSRTLQAHRLKSMTKKPRSPIARLTDTAERGFAALAEDIAKLPTKDDLAAAETRLDRRIDKLAKMTKFEEHQIDKRKQLEVRVSAIEKHLGLDKKIAA
jgi:hypothetical protein